MDAQITKPCKAGFFYLHNLSGIRRYLDQESTEKLIHAFVTSRLDYCNSLLYGLPDCRLLKLQRVQNAAARLVFRAPKLCHITPLLKSLHWLNIKCRIEFKLLLITYKAVHGLAPEYLKDLIDIKQNNTTYSLRSNDSSFKLNAPSIKTLKTLGDRCFMIAAPKLWNSLPQELREKTNVDIFKRRLKTYLFRKHFNCYLVS